MERVKDLLNANKVLSRCQRIFNICVYQKLECSLKLNSPRANIVLKKNIFQGAFLRIGLKEVNKDNFFLWSLIQFDFDKTYSVLTICLK